MLNDDIVHDDNMLRLKELALKWSYRETPVLSYDDYLLSYDFNILTKGYRANPFVELSRIFFGTLCFITTTLQLAGDAI